MIVVASRASELPSLQLIYMGWEYNNGTIYVLMLNQPLKELSALIRCWYTSMPLRNTLSSRNCNVEITLNSAITLHKKKYDSRQRLITSLWSWSKIGVFIIGENPRAGTPICLTNRASVVEDKISGFASFPPEEIIACSNTDHHGFNSLAGVSKGRPVTSLTGPFFNS